MKVNCPEFSGMGKSSLSKWMELLSFPCRKMGAVSQLEQPRRVCIEWPGLECFDEVPVLANL